MITHESLELETACPGVVRVRYVQIDGGIHRGGTLIFGWENSARIADELEACCEHEYQSTEPQAGSDHLRVYQSGGDDRPIVNILCRREEGLPFAGLTGLMLTIEYAKEPAARLIDGK